MKNLIWRGLLLILAGIFLVQTFSSFYVIPIYDILYLISGTTDFSRVLVISFAVVIPVLFIISFVAEIAYSVGFRRKIVSNILNKYLKQGLMLFLNAWITMFIYGLGASIGIFPDTTSEIQILNLYLFWYMIINVLFFSKQFIIFKKIDKEILDSKRIGWFSQLFGLNGLDGFMGDRGQIVYKQSLFYDIVSRVPFFLAIIIFALLSLLPLNLFLNIINGGVVEPEYFRPIILFISGFFASVLVIAGIYFLGILLSRKIIIYQKCLCIPLPTISDEPIFTLLLPRSKLFINFEDILYCQIKKKRKKYDEIHFDKFIFYLKSGQIIILRPFDSNISVLVSYLKQFISVKGE